MTQPMNGIRPANDSLAQVKSFDVCHPRPPSSPAVLGVLAQQPLLFLCSTLEFPQCSLGFALILCIVNPMLFYLA